MPGTLVVSEAYPSPFSTSTMLRITLPESAWMTVTVHDKSGKYVMRLVSGCYPQGLHRVPFRPRRLSGGVYLVRVEVEGYGAVVRKAVHERATDLQ